MSDYDDVCLQHPIINNHLLRTGYFAYDVNIFLLQQDPLHPLADDSKSACKDNTNHIVAIWLRNVWLNSS